MTCTEDNVPTRAPADDEARAAEDFVRRRFGHWTADDQAAFEAKLVNDRAYADAVGRVELSWQAVGRHAISPELMGLREQAISRARRASARRWMGTAGRQRVWRLAAGFAALAIALAAAVQLSPLGYTPGLYRTRIGEQRVVELEDHSRIALDANTRLRVRYSEDARIVQLLEGQAQFSVAKDPGRPFKVEAGEHVVVAVGTVFTVEYVQREMHVAMLEGRVAVVTGTSVPSIVSAQDHSRPAPARVAAREQGAIELAAGEELRVDNDGQAIVNPKADLDVATAWRRGKVIFHDEPLLEAVRRLNRYSRVQLAVDDASLASLQVSGVFDADDTRAFVEAVQVYLPVVADDSDADTIHLRMK